MTTATARLLAALSAALAFPLALPTAPPAAAATVGVTTWGDLKSAFLVDGDTVRLDANITAPANESLVIDAGESIILDLNGFVLTITDPGTDNAAFSVPATSSLTINATGGGTLTATGASSGAGIGGGDGGNGGTTIINGGAITATGGLFAAGIGGGDGIGGGGTGGITTINGGTTIATGGEEGAGIGGGPEAAGGITTINGGTTIATGGDVAAGIGGGYLGGPGVLHVNGTADVGAATNGGGPEASGITNPTTPVGVGYSAATSTVGSGGRIELRFNYVITLTANGGSTTAAQTVDDGDTLTEPATPTREGFTFTGWTSEGSAYDFSTPVTEPLELAATWTESADETSPPDETPELADTGADVATTLSLSTLLMAGGALLIALRRRAVRHSA